MEAPPSLKAIKHHLKIASDVESSQPVVAYYMRFYSLQKALEIDKSSPEARTFIGNVMTNLEDFKSKHDDEGLRSDVVGQSIVEGYAHLLFKKADEMDRAGHFTPNLVKLFYTASLIFESLSTFGTVTEDIDKIRKYCKWKAAYLTACLKSGETPVAGPPLENPEFADVAASYSKGVSPSTGEPIDESALAPPVPKASSSSSSPNKLTSQTTIDLPDVPSLFFYSRLLFIVLINPFSFNRRSQRDTFFQYGTRP